MTDRVGIPACKPTDDGGQPTPKGDETDRGGEKLLAMLGEAKP